MNTNFKGFLYTIVFFIATTSFAQTNKEVAIQINAITPEIISINNIDANPDQDGYVDARKVILPVFEKGCYYRPFSAGGHDGPNANRVTGLAFNTLKELSDFGPKLGEETVKNAANNLDLGQFLLLKLKNDSYLALMPLATKNIMSVFSIQNGELILKSGHFGTEHVKGTIDALATASGTTPYEATSKMWEKVLDSGLVETNWRMNKKYPEMYQYMGWCSWEHYRLDINTANMTEAVKTLEANPVPFRWFMVDDGYLNEEKRRLINFEPDLKKFPKGWQEVTHLKSKNGIRWMGLWRNMLGYMSGISKQENMNLPKGTFAENAKGSCLVPNGTAEGAKAFYDELATKTKEGGFDFAKVDFQGKALFMYYGMENPIRSMYYNSIALENACKEHLDGLLNCIAQTHINVFNTKYSALTRSSKDYSKKAFNKEITYQSFANHLWLGQVVWGDLDMFHSQGEDAKQLAIARAISGGPVYVSDEPSTIDATLLLPFGDNDGKIFRSDAPAVLLPESFFIDPYKGKEAFRVIAPTANKVAALAVFNFTENKTVTSFISPEDYTSAGEQLQPYSGKWILPKEGLLAYNQQTQQIQELSKKLTFEMEPNEAKLFMLFPKTKGWAVIGRTDKYLSAAAVKIESIEDSKIVFTLSEYGPFAIWSKKGIPKMQGVEFKAAGKGLYTTKIPIEAVNKKCEITR